MLEAVLRRQSWIIAGCLGGLAATAWWYTLDMAARMSVSMAGMVTMGAHRMILAPHDVLIMFIMWTLMMVAMMLPAATPAVLIHAAARRQRQHRSALKPTALFVLGYVAAWTLFSLAATLLQWALHDLALLTGAMAIESQLIAGVVLVTVGVYQWSPLKYACLRHCQSPIGFFFGHWREDPAGVFGMGLRHGLYCVGCCWLLMLILFLVGVMNLVWVAAIALYVLAEKIPAVGQQLSQISGLVAICIGVTLLAGR